MTTSQPAILASVPAQARGFTINTRPGADPKPIPRQPTLANASRALVFGFGFGVELRFGQPDFWVRGGRDDRGDIARIGDAITATP